MLLVTCHVALVRSVTCIDALIKKFFPSSETSYLVSVPALMIFSSLIIAKRLILNHSPRERFLLDDKSRLTIQAAFPIIIYTQRYTSTVKSTHCPLRTYRPILLRYSFACSCPMWSVINGGKESSGS